LSLEASRPAVAGAFEERETQASAARSVGCGFRLAVLTVVYDLALELGTCPQRFINLENHRLILGGHDEDEIPYVLRYHKRPQVTIELEQHFVIHPQVADIRDLGIHVLQNTKQFAKEGLIRALGQKLDKEILGTIPRSHSVSVHIVPGQKAFDRRRAARICRILAAEYGRVNLGRSCGPMTCDIAPPCYAASLGVLGRNPSAANAAGYSTSIP
jgi:hypothetical protein